MSPNDLLARLREWWQAQDNKRKFALIAAGTLVIVTIIVLGQILLRPTYAPLFTQLDPAEAGSIVEELNTLNVPYQLTDGGKTIEVPEGQVYETRIKLASSGVLVGSGTGFELFDQQKFGITDFEQQVGYQRALQEELRRTIIQLDEVEQARIHLVLPEKTLFSEDQGEPSASIALKLKTAATLKPEQVQGVVDLVTGAVEGLQPENIHIIDMKGNILNDSLPAKGSGTVSVESTTRQNVKREFEKQLENRIHQMLFRVLGPGSAVAMVTAELNFDQEQSSSTTHGPGQVISRQEIEEQGSGGGAEGPVGTDELGTFPGLENNNEDTFLRNEDVTNYQVDIYRQTVVKSPGDVERLSVALVIDQAALGDIPDQETYNERLNQIRELIASAVGYRATRGDQITVSSMPFDTGVQDMFQEETPETQALSIPKINPILLGGIAAGILILLLLIFILLRRRKKRRVQEIPAVPPQSEDYQEEPEPVIPREKDPRDKIRDLAKERPNDIAEIIKLWLKE